MTGALRIFPRIIYACMAAALFGALHNQISYSVSPAYFHDFKFIQFQIATPLQNRIGAALVGVLASWWMGLILGTPIALASLMVKPPKRAARVFRRATFGVVVGTLILACLTLLVTIPDEVGTQVYVPPTVQDPKSFIQAGVMHSTSYLAGAITGVIALGSVDIRGSHFV